MNNRFLSYQVSKYNLLSELGLSNKINISNKFYQTFLSGKNKLYNIKIHHDNMRYIRGNVSSPL